MRLESFKARWIGSGNPSLQPQRSPSIDSSEDDARIRVDDPSLRLQISESPSPLPPDHHGSGDIFTYPAAAKPPTALDSNMNTTTQPPHPQVWQEVYLNKNDWLICTHLSIGRELANLEVGFKYLTLK